MQKYILFASILYHFPLIYLFIGFHISCLFVPKHSDTVDLWPSTYLMYTEVKFLFSNSTWTKCLVLVCLTMCHGKTVPYFNNQDSQASEVIICLSLRHCYFKQYHLWREVAKELDQFLLLFYIHINLALYSIPFK